MRLDERRGTQSYNVANDLSDDKQCEIPPPPVPGGGSQCLLPNLASEFRTDAATYHFAQPAMIECRRLHCCTTWNLQLLSITRSPEPRATLQ